MSGTSLPMTPPASAGTAAPRSGRLPWARWVLVMIGLAAVAGAGWVGYQQQLSAVSNAVESTADNVVASRVERAASGLTTGSTAAATAGNPAPSSRRDVKVFRGVAAAPAASAGGQPELRWPLWAFQLNQPIPPRDPPLTPVAWRLVGATLSSDGWKVVILRQGNTTPEYFGVGAVLPGGYKIRAITDEDVTFDINKREVILSYTGSR